ncbi:MAG: hypothetical protein AAGF30_00480 [Pseudomonadota bacterium]
MSSRKFSGAMAGRAEVLTYRQAFARRWQSFVRAHFEDAAHVAHVFRVDATTAANWWAGANAPQGWVVARAVSDPDLGPSVVGYLREAA